MDHWARIEFVVFWTNKTMETNQKPWKTIQPPWKTMETNQKPWNHLEKPWKPTKNHEKPWNHLEKPCQQCKPYQLIILIILKAHRLADNWHQEKKMILVSKRHTNTKCSLSFWIIGKKCPTKSIFSPSLCPTGHTDTQKPNLCCRCWQKCPYQCLVPNFPFAEIYLGASYYFLCQIESFIMLVPNCPL